MKNKLSTAVTLALMTLQNSPSYDMVVGTNHFGVAFETPAIPSSLEDFIVADVQRCYDAWGTNVVIESGLPGRYGSYVSRDVFVGPYYSENLDVEELRVPRHLVTNETGRLSLEIPSALIEKYSDALIFKTNHLVQVQAADAFVAFVSSAEFKNVTSNDVVNYFLIKDAIPQAYLNSGETIVRDLSSCEFFSPSILGFTYSDRGPDATNLWVFVPVIPKTRTALSSFDVFPAIWHDGKWKFCFWDATE